MAFIGNLLCGSESKPSPYTVDYFLNGGKPREPNWEAFEMALKSMYPQTKDKA